MHISDTPTMPPGGANTEHHLEAQHQAASWPAKRLILRLQLANQVWANEHAGIDTGVIVYDITDQKPVYSHKINTVHYAASINKLFVTSLLLEDLRAGKVTLETALNWQPSDRRAGAGEFDSDGAPTTATVRSVLFDMLNRSGNTAVRVIVNKVLGGAAAVNQRLEQDYPQLKVTRLQPVDENRFLLGYTTPAEADFIFARLYKQNNDLYGYIVRNALATNIFNDYGPRSQVKDKDAITVIDKQGQLNDPEGNNRHDVGVIENTKNGHKLRYTLMTTNYENPAGELTNKAILSLQEFGRDMLRFEGDRMPWTQPAPQTKQSSPKTENSRTIY